MPLSGTGADDRKPSPDQSSDASSVPSGSNLAGPSSSKPRISQRAPASCSFCYRRKIKCDKQIPCQNCLKRGAAEGCTREPVVVRGELIGVDQQRVPLTTEELRMLSEAQLRQEVAALRKKLTEQEKLVASLRRAEKMDRSTIGPEASGSLPSARTAGISAGLSPGRLQTTTKPHMSPPPYNTAPATPPLFPKRSSGSAMLGRLPDVDVGDTSAHGTIATSALLPADSDEGDILKPYLQQLDLPIGPSTSGLSNKRKADQSTSPGVNSFPMKKPRVFPSPLADTVASSTPLLSLVPLHYSVSLVEMTLRTTAWIHGVVHVPTYIRNHAVWVEEVKRGTAIIRDEYLALYFAIIASGLYFLDSALGTPLGLSSNEVATLPNIWFEACLEAVPTIDALQTMCILPMVSHTFGATAYVDALLHSGLRIAMSLNLHLLGPETDESSRRGLIGREIGRRIWMLLTIAESHTDASISSVLYLPPAVTVPPANVNDEDLHDGYPLVLRPLSQTTLTTHIRAICARAQIFRSFSARFYAASTLEEQYSAVIETDGQLLQVLQQFPNLAPRVDPYPTSINFHAPFDYVPMSRYLWAMAIPPTRIILYRSFLGRSYSDERFADVRHICIEAAKQVLIERRRPVPAIYQKPWHVSAYTVLAGVILVTEYIHGNGTPDARAQLYADVQEIISLLPLGGANNKVVVRGVELLTRVLEDAAASERSKEVQFASVESLWPPMEEWSWMQPMEPTNDIWANALKSFEATGTDTGDWLGEKWWIA